MSPHRLLLLALLAGVFFSVPPVVAGTERVRFALILEDPPAVKSMPRGATRNSTPLSTLRQNIRLKQATLRTQIEARGMTVTGSADTLLNAVFVSANRSDLAALQSLPGVKYVTPVRRAKTSLDRAAILLNAPSAWSILGGIGNAGAGNKIAIIDTGIDQTHPGFQDSTLAMPAGYPLCDTVANCAFTNNKVIVARSYVSTTAGVSDPESSLPDDYSARDRVGHGTSVAMCAGGNTNQGPLATITGLAPHAYLGNYKVFGSPGINDGASTDAIIGALEDAYRDGMDVVVLSNGYLPISGPLDTGSACGAGPGQPCDPEVLTIQNMVETQNIVVVVAAGNDGSIGVANSSNGNSPTLNTISSPAYAPDAIAVAATGNSRTFVNSVHIAGPNVPSNLTTIGALYGGPAPVGTLTAPLVDASGVGDALGCTAYPAGSFQGDIPLMERGTCNFSVKVQNAAAAGAVGVLIYDNLDAEAVFPPGGLETAQIPGFLISNSDGVALKTYLTTASGITAELDPNVSGATLAPDVNQVTSFSSRGPSIGTNALKPDVDGPGENIYMATQNYDTSGALYDPTRYVTAGGTSFSTPMVAGIAALVRQSHPSFTAAQVKSAIVNTATSDTSDPFTHTTPSSVISVGGGKADAFNAIQSNVTVEPATASFGVLATAFSTSSQALTITNHSTSSLTLALSVVRTTADSATQLTLDQNSLTLSAGQAGTVHLVLSGTRPLPGSYEGAVQITGGASALHVPYLYLVGDGIAQNIYPLAGDYDSGFVAGPTYIGGIYLRVIDQFGVPVANAPVTWSARDGGTVGDHDSLTDSYGIAGAAITLGPDPATYTFRASVTGSSLQYSFTDYAYPEPLINAGGVVNAATSTLGNGVAPGSYVSIYGSDLSNTTESAQAVPLPIALTYISVAFVTPSVSLPGALYYVSPSQINVQVPWELQGQSSVRIKINNEPLNGSLITVPLAAFSPGIFASNGSAAALDLNGNIITTATPIARGAYVALFCNGLGPVSNQPATGSAASASPLSATLTTPTVTIGGQPAVIQFSGLAPGFSGLYQINALVPAGIAAGSQPVALSINGIAATVVNLPVK